MASVTFKRGTKAEIEATAKQDGQILMETDQTNNKMYVDLQNNNRVRIGNSNVDDISGITDSLTATSSNIALSAAGGNNLQGQIDTLNSNLEYFVDMKNNNNIFKFTNTYLLQINCPNGYGAMTIYGFMQNYGAFMVHVSCISGNASIIDVINQASGLGLLKTL